MANNGSTTNVPHEHQAGEETGLPPRTRYGLIKSVLDVVLAVVLLVALAPLVLVAMLLVKLTSPGPALYSQERLGRGGRRFTIYKVRSMAHDCERFSGPQWATANDPRITPMGRFLRASHLDELPQLWNVLRGDMSLIGPRPERPTIAEGLERSLPSYRERLQVRPGITGLAQVQLPPDEDLHSVRRKLTCDLYYVEKMNPLLDLQILMATATKVFGLPCGTVCKYLRIPSDVSIAEARRRQAAGSPAYPGGGFWPMQTDLDAASA